MTSNTVNIVDIVLCWSNRIQSATSLVDKIGSIFGQQESEFDDVIMGLLDDYTIGVANIISPTRATCVVEFLYWFWVDQEFGKFSKGHHPITGDTVHVHNIMDLSELIIEHLSHD